MRVAVDKDVCIGCGLCPELCPEAFEMGGDEKAHPKINPVPRGTEIACREAAEQCPVSAITIEEE